jgi:hypothetical protein
MEIKIDFLFNKFAFIHFSLLLKCNLQSVLFADVLDYVESVLSYLLLQIQLVQIQVLK